jgi:spore maturation protein CgeB
MKQLLLIGDTSLSEALGSKLLRGRKILKTVDHWQINVSYHSPAPNYSPSMNRKRGKIFYRLADKRSYEWWGYQESLLKQVQELRPDLVLVTGVMPLDRRIFRIIEKQGGSIVNYLTDDPWNPIHRRHSFITNLPSYNHIFSTKKALQSRLKKAGAPSTSWLPFAYDPELHYPVQAKGGADVVFIGTGDQERLAWLKAVTDIPGIQRRIHGNSWRGITTPGWEQQPAVTGECYCQAISGAKVVLGLLRAKNGDQSTDRSYEIGAIGGCGLYQDTNEHRQLLPEYPEEGFFKDPAQLTQRIIDVLADAGLQQKLRSIGAKAIRKPKNTYGARLETILQWVEQ